MTGLVVGVTVMVVTVMVVTVTVVVVDEVVVSVVVNGMDVVVDLLVDIDIGGFGGVRWFGRFKVW